MRPIPIEHLALVECMGDICTWKLVGIASTDDVEPADGRRRLFGSKEEDELLMADLAEQLEKDNSNQ